MKVGRHKILQVNGNKPNSITSLVSFKHNVLCKAVACLLICVFTITNITYGHDRSDLDTLKRVRNRESAASETVVNHEFVASSPVVQKPARTATTVTEPAREEVVMSYDVAWVLGNMARLENSYARAVRKEAQKILQHGLWHRRRVERSYRVVRKRVELYLKMLSRWSVAHEVLDDYSRRLDLIHRDIMDIFTVLEDLSWPVEYSRKSTPSGDVITIAPVSPRMAEKAERRAGSVWERWQAQREGGIKWASRFVAAKERIEEQKRSVDEVSGEAAKLMPELNSLNAFKSDLKAAFMKELATLTIDAEGSFERCLTARVFLDGGDQQAKAFRRVIGSYFPTTSERLIEGSAQDVFETMTENRKSEEERRVKHDYDIAIELPHSLGNITTALRFDETAQDLLSKSVGRDFMILRIGSGAIAAVKILAGASIIWAVLMILMPKAGTEPATPKAPRAPPALTAIEIAKLVEDTQTPPPSKEDLLVSQHALLNEIIDTVNAMGVDSEEAKKRRAAVIENINKRKEALEDEKNKIAESQTQLDEKMAPPQELTAQLADIRSEASGLEDITLTEEERRTPPVPQEWSPMQERPAPALPERTDDGFSGFPGLEGGLFGRGDARLAINDIGPDKVTHGGGNTEMGPWIASVKGNIRYLGKAGYSRINPVTGEYSPVEPKWQSWKLDSARTPSGWVAMAAYNARETVILMPPGHVVVDIHTENPGVKGSVYYDTANRVWVVKFDREPGNLFRVGVAPAKPGELKKIGVIEIDEKAGDTWRDSLPDAVQRILDLAKKLPLEQRKEVKNGIMKRLYYTTNPLIDELMGEEDNFIRITFKLFAVKCDGAILADASLSHELDAAMAIEVGLMDADGNGSFHLGEMHAWGETPDGIEEATALLGATSPLFGKRATDREWRKELEHIRKRAERALQELEILYEKLRLGEKEKELEEEIARAEAEMAEVAVTTLESSRGSYERLLGEYDRKLNAIPVLSDVDVDLNNCLPDIESLLEVCRQFEFTAQNAGNDLQLMALGHFLFRILERIEDRNNQRAFYVGDTVAFARLERDILDARAQLFEKIEDFAAENGRKLSEPFPKHVYPPGMNYRPSSGKKPEEDIIIIEVPVGEWVESYTFDTQGNLVISVGVVPLSRNDIVYETTYKNGMKIVRGYKKERFVIDTVTGERIEIPSHVPVNVVDYSNGIAVINYAGDCYELRGEGTDEYRTIIYSGFKGLYTALNGEWLACVERDDEGWKFIGPLAEKTELMLNIITNIRYVREESIRVLPNGKWIAVVEYEDGTQGYVGTLALRGRRLLHGQSYAVRVDDPVVFSDGTWLGSWYNRETESTELCGTHAEQFRNDITEALPEGVDTATMTSVVLTDYAFTPDGDWLAVVAFGDGTQGFIGPIATKLNLTERIPPTEAMGNEYRTVRRIDEVHPEGLVVLTCYEVSESPTANTWPVNAVQICVGPVAKTAHLDKIKEILHVELLPDDTCFAVIDKGDSWAFLKVLGSGLNSAGMTKRDDSTMGGFIILPDGSWIASYSIGGTEGETRADGSTMLNWGVIQRYTTEGTLITTESPGTLWKVTGPIAVRARSSRQVFLDKPIMAPNGSFCGLVRDGDNYAFKGPLADKGGLASEKFPYWPDKAAVISDGRWLVTSPVEGGGFRLTGPLSSIGDVGKITWDTLPYEIAVKETPFGVALYVNDICYFEPKEGAGVNYLERLEALYNTGSFRVYPHIGEGRPDLLWQACEALTKRRMTRAWTSLHRVLDNVGLDPYSVDQPSPRHNFDLEKALKVIRENIWILQQYNEEELYRFLEAVSAGHIIIECLYDLEEGRSSDQRMKQIIETCGFTEAQWNRIISDYIQHLKEEHGIPASSDPHLLQCNFGHRYQSRVAALNVFLKTHAENIEGYVAYAEEMDKLSALITTHNIPYEERGRSVLHISSLQGAFAFLRSQCGMEDKYFDVEFSALNRLHWAHKAAMLLRRNWEGFKVSYDPPLWDNEWHKNLVKWRGINNRLAEIFENNIEVTVSPVSPYRLFWQEFTHDVIGVALLAWSILSTLSYIADRVRERYRYKESSEKKIVGRIWSENPWFTGEEAAVARQFLDEIMPVTGRELTDEEKAQLEELRSGLTEPQRAIFDAVRCIAIEQPDAPRRWYTHLKNLRTLGFLFAKDSRKNMTRKVMNRAILTHVRAIDENTAPETFYARLRDILRKYCKEKNLEGETEEGVVRDAREVTQEIAEAIDRIKHLDIETIESYFLKPDGAFIKQTAPDGTEFSHLDEIQPGEHARKDEWSSARAGKDMKRVYQKDVKRKASMLLNMPTLFDNEFAERWIEGFAAAMVVVLFKNRVSKKRETEQDKLIFVMPNGGKLHEIDIRSRERRPHRILAIFRDKYEEALSLRESRRNAEYDPYFYDEARNRRYRERTEGIFGKDRDIDRAIEDDIKRLDLRNEYVLCVGVRDEKEAAVHEALRKNAITPIFCRKGMTGPLSSRPASRTSTVEMQPDEAHQPEGVDFYEKELSSLQPSVARTSTTSAAVESAVKVTSSEDSHGAVGRTTTTQSDEMVKEDIDKLLKLLDGDIIDAVVSNEIELDIQIDNSRMPLDPGKREALEEAIKSWLTIINIRTGGLITGSFVPNGGKDNGLVAITAGRKGVRGPESRIGSCSVDAEADINTMPRLIGFLNIAFAGSLIPENIEADEYNLADYDPLFRFIDGYHMLLTGENYFRDLLLRGKNSFKDLSAVLREGSIDDIKALISEKVRRIFIDLPPAQKIECDIERLRDLLRAV